MSFKSLNKAKNVPKENEASYKLVLVGDSGVGKSCLLQKLLDITSTNTFISTIGVDIRNHVCTLNGNSYKLQVWDTGGQERYRPALAACYRNAHAVIVVFDVTNAKSFANLSQWMKEVSEFTNAQSTLTISPKKLLIGNKCDLEERRQINREKAENFAKANQMDYLECSAVAVLNIMEAFMTPILNNKGLVQQQQQN